MAKPNKQAATRKYPAKRAGEAIEMKPCIYRQGRGRCRCRGPADALPALHPQA
jgi:hypothetical protein